MKGSTDPHSSSAALLAAFGAAVLDINRLARDKTLERFHRTALERLQQLVPFQRAWWGRAALIDGVPVEHSAHLFNLEEHYVEDWKSISHDDITVGLVHARPGTAVAVDMQATAGLRWLGARHDIGELLCVIHVDPITRLSDHVALYRTPGGPPFADQEKLLLGQLSAHLARPSRPTRSVPWWPCANPRTPGSGHGGMRPLRRAALRRTRLRRPAARRLAGLDRSAVAGGNQPAGLSRCASGDRLAAGRRPLPAHRAATERSNS